MPNQITTTITPEPLSEYDLNALLFAEKLQQNMLSKAKTIAGYSFYHLYLPKRFVSGDYLDFWAVDNGVLFYLADVSGHGVCSGMLSQWLSGFRTRFSDPLTLINAVNENLIALNISQHITLFVGMIEHHDSQKTTLTYCNAGHFPPAFIFHDQNPQPTQLESEQLPLGIMLDAEYQSTQIDLQPTDRLVICSDGALENYYGDGIFQLTSLTKALSQHHFQLNLPLNDDLSILWITPQQDT